MTTSPDSLSGLLHTLPGSPRAGDGRSGVTVRTHTSTDPVRPDTIDGCFTPARGVILYNFYQQQKFGNPKPHQRICRILLSLLRYVGHWDDLAVMKFDSNGDVTNTIIEVCQKKGCQGRQDKNYYFEGSDGASKFEI